MRIDNISEREIKRVKTVEQAGTSRILSSNPPDLLRNRYISEKVKDEENLKLSEEDTQQIGIEFGKVEEMIHCKLLSDYQEHKVFDYYGELTL